LYRRFGHGLALGSASGSLTACGFALARTAAKVRKLPAARIAGLCLLRGFFSLVARSSGFRRTLLQDLISRLTIDRLVVNARDGAHAHDLRTLVRGDGSHPG